MCEVTLEWTKKMSTYHNKAYLLKQKDWSASAEAIIKHKRRFLKHWFNILIDILSTGRHKGALDLYCSGVEV